MNEKINKKKISRKKITKSEWLKSRNDTLLKVVALVCSKERKFTKNAWMIENIYEAYCSCEWLLKYILDNPNFNPECLRADFHEIYHHTNLAWHSKNVPTRKIKNVINNDKKTWNKWVNFPKNGSFATLGKNKA